MLLRDHYFLQALQSSYQHFPSVDKIKIELSLQEFKKFYKQSFDWVSKKKIGEVPHLDFYFDKYEGID